MTLPPSGRIRLLVVGGHSRAALAFRRAALASGQFDVAFLVRRSGDIAPGEVQHVVQDYFAPPDEVFSDIDCLVNFTGAPSLPSADDLWRLNAQGPIQLAERAKSAGVRRFIQLSSLSIFGGAEDIGRDTRPAPKTLYGRTKLAAEEGLQRLAGPQFSVVLARAPLIYGPDGGGKLFQLVRLLRKVRLFPVPNPLQPRSMVHVNNLALGLLVLAQGRESEAAFIMDPTPFRLDRLVAVLRAAGGEGIGLITLPSVVFRLLQAAAPGAYESLYRRSLIRAEDGVPLPPHALALEQSLLDVL
jgi:nucleoside-diphosphate-sugar epimerase